MDVSPYARERLGNGGDPVRSRIRVLLCSHSEVLATGLKEVLKPEDDVEVSEEVPYREELSRAVRRLRPQVVLIAAPLDPSIVKAVRAAGENTVGIVLLYSEGTEIGTTIDSLRAGARGIISSESNTMEVVDAVRIVASGDAVLTPSIARRLLDWVSRAWPQMTSPPAAAGRLSRRESEVLGLVAQGYSNSEIAQRLVVSEATVRSHVQHLMAKLGVEHRAQAVAYAYRYGLVEPP